MNINDLNIQMKRVNSLSTDGPWYVHDIDTPTFDHVHKQIVTKNFVLEPLGYKHFLDLFEFRIQNEPIEVDPFDNLGKRFDDAYTQFFNYICNVDNLAWVMLDRIYVTGFFLLEIEVDYNKYMDRNAHLYYEILSNLDQVDVHKEMIKGISDNLFSETDIPRIDLHLDESHEDKASMKALEELGYKRILEKEDKENIRYTLLNNEPRLESPPRHMAYILKAYRENFETQGKI